jgi:hypothetical protein
VIESKADKKVCGEKARDLHRFAYCRIKSPELPFGIAAVEDRVRINGFYLAQEFRPSSR